MAFQRSARELLKRIRVIADPIRFNRGFWVLSSSRLAQGLGQHFLELRLGCAVRDRTGELDAVPHRRGAGVRRDLTSPPSGKLKQELQTEESDTQPPASSP